MIVVVVAVVVVVGFEIVDGMKIGSMGCCCYCYCQQRYYL